MEPSKAGATASSAKRSWGLPLLAGFFGLAMVLEATTLPLLERYTGLGSGFMVAFVGTALLLIAAALSWQVQNGIRFQPESGEGVDETVPVSKAGLALAGLGIALPIISIPLAGFPLGAGLAYACVTRAYGSMRLLRDVVIGIALASATWLAFTKLGVQLGPFLPLVGAK